MRGQDNIATNQMARKAPVTPAGDRRDTIKRPNIERLVEYIDQQEDPESIMNAYISLFKVCSDEVDDSLGEFEIAFRNVPARLNKSHLLKKIG